MMADAASAAVSTDKKGQKQTVEGGKKKNKGKKPCPAGDGAPGSSSRQVQDSGTPMKGTDAMTTPIKSEADQGTQQVQPAKGEKSQKKQEKQNKAAQPKPEGAQAAGSGEQKSKAQLKAERRAIQEAQRAAKEAKKAEASANAGAASGGSHPGPTHSGGNAKKETASKKGGAGDVSKSSNATHEKGTTEKKQKKKIATIDMKSLSENEYWTMKEQDIIAKYIKIDNSILNLGFQYFHHKIVGGNARCVALLTTLKEIIAKYKTPEEKELSRDLEKNFLTPCITYLNYCRPLSTSMGNAIKYLKYHINQIPRGMDDETAIERLQEVIDSFIYDNIIKAAEAVAFYADSKIDNDDVILVYAASSLISQVLKTAYANGKRFRVIVVEGRPRTEGKSMLRYLVHCGIPCSYVYIGSASYAMSEATKVFLGASAMFAIGDMLSRTGNSMIAALAKANNIPVLVCCETYKFTDKVQLHSVDSNIHARGSDLISIGHKEPLISNYEEIGLRLLNLMYDVTQSRYITALVTELGMLPCTSVPVVLRRQEDLTSDVTL